MRKWWKSERGSAVPLIVAVTLACLLLFCVVVEFMRLYVIASGVKDAMQNAVVSVINDNYNETYHAIREGYAAGYEPMEETFRESLDYGDIYGQLDELLGTQMEGERHIKRNRNGTLEFSLEDLEVEIRNVSLASAGNGEEYMADARIQLLVPVSLAGEHFPDMRFTIRMKAKYMPKF